MRLTRASMTELEALVRAYPRRLVAHAGRYVDPLLGTVALELDGAALIWRWPPGVRVRLVGTRAEAGTVLAYEGRGRAVRVLWGDHEREHESTALEVAL